MSQQASQLIAQQFINGGVVPADLAGQSSVSKKYVDDKINAVDKKASKAQSDITSHIGSTAAHDAQNITYSGEVAGANNVKNALDILDNRVDNIVAQSGSDITEIVDARGGYPVLSSRLDSSDERLVGKANKRSFDVIDYGADHTGKNDSTLAIQTATNAAISNGGGILFFPPGEYRITSSISVQSSSIQIEGAGPGTTKVVFSGCDGFNINNFSATDKHPVQFYDLSILANDLGLYTAINFIGEPNPTISKQLTVYNVEFTGIDNATCWDVGIKLTYGHYSDIRNCMFKGCTSNVNEMNCGVYIDASTDVKLIGNYYYWLNVGVNITGVTIQSEGIVVTDSHFAPCNYGVVNQDNAGNYMIVSSCHIGSVIAGVVLGRSGVNGGSFSQILNNLIFKDGASTSSFIGINIQAASYNKIMGNDIALSGSGGSENGIVINGTDGHPTTYNHIVNNNICDMDGSAILLGEFTQYNVVTGNCGFNDGAGVFNLGTKNFVYQNAFNGQITP